MAAETDEIYSTERPSFERWPNFEAPMQAWSEAWDAAFIEERARLLALAGVRGEVQSIEHVGSTSVRGLASRPVIDLLLTVDSLAASDRVISHLEPAGYVFERDSTVRERRLFGRGHPVRTHHVHVVVAGHPWAERLLAHRDFLRAFPAEARAYGECKRAALAAAQDMFDYFCLKHEHVKASSDRAVSWARSGRAALPASLPPAPLGSLEAAAHPAVASYAAGRLVGVFGRMGMEDPAGRVEQLFSLVRGANGDATRASADIHRAVPDFADPSSTFYQRMRALGDQQTAEFATHLAPAVKGPVVLDVGAGDPSSIEKLMELAPAIERGICSDIHPPWRQPQRANVEVVLQPSITSTGLAPASVDSIVMRRMLHHVRFADQHALLVHLRSLLREGGRLLLVEDSYADLEATGETSEREGLSLLAFRDFIGNRIFYSQPEVPLPNTFRSPEGWASLLRQTGFTVKSSHIQRDVFPPKLFIVAEPGPRDVAAEPASLA